MRVLSGFGPLPVQAPALGVAEAQRLEALSRAEYPTLRGVPADAFPLFLTTKCARAAPAAASGLSFVLISSSSDEFSQQQALRIITCGRERRLFCSANVHCPAEYAPVFVNMRASVMGISELRGYQPDINLAAGANQ